MLLQLISLAVIIPTVIQLVAMFASFPTEAHRDINRQLHAMTSTENGSIIVDYTSPQYLAVSSTPEARYTTRADIIGSFGTLIVLLILIRYTYTRLRRDHIAANPISATVAIITLASIITSIIMMFATSYYLSVDLMPLNLILSGLMISTLLMLFITYLLTRAFKWDYDKKHSFDLT